MPSDQKRLPLAFGTDGADYSSESDRGPVPVPATTPVERNGQPGDRHVLVLQKGRCELTELYNAVRAGRGWRVSSAARWDLTREQRRRPATRRPTPRACRSSPGCCDPRWAPVIDELHNRHPIDGGDFEVVAGGPVTTCGSR